MSSANPVADFATSTQPVALRVDGITKSFGATRALGDVSFEVRGATIHALLGGNGSGKSTLIRILAGVEHADRGRIEVAGLDVDARRSSPNWAAEAGLRFVHQGAPTFPGLTVLDDFAVSAGYGCRALAQVNRRRLRRLARAALDRFGVDVPLHAAMAELRPATRTMVAVARALRDDEASILVLDEPTAALPADEAERLLTAVSGYAEQGHTVILVSHRLHDILSVAQAATFLRDGRLLETRPLAGMDERALVERIAGSDEELRRRRVYRPEGGPRLELRGVSAGPLDGISLSVGRGEILGFAGLLGSGRSSLLQGIFGARPLRAGAVVLDGEEIDVREPAQAVGLGIAYVPEDRAGDAIFADRTVRENFTIADIGRYWRRLSWDRRREAVDARAAIDEYGVVGSDSDMLSTLSGGNQQKVIMARWLHIAPRVLLLDEPSQGVDVGARDAIHGFIRRAAERGTSVLVASSDAAELALLCDRVVGLRAGGTAGEATLKNVTPGRVIELAQGFNDSFEEMPK